MAQKTISESALAQRVKRALESRGQTLRLARPSERDALGRYYVVDKVGVRGIINKDVDIVEMAREMNLLRPWEKAGK